MYSLIRSKAATLRRPFLVAITALLLSIQLLAPPATIAAPDKILILPFTIHAEKDMAFLNQGVVSMLLSRLSKPGKTVTEAVSKPPGTPAELASLARAHGATYYTSGSLTLFGNSVSTDARLIETDTGRTVVTYNQYGERAGDVLAHMDAFARKIDAELMAAAAPKPVAPAAATPAPAAATAAVVAGTAAGAAAAAAPAGAPPMTPATTPAPSVPSPATAKGAGVAVAAAPPQAPQSPATAGDPASAFFESQALGEEIRSMTTADLDGDGRMEIICASARRVSIYQFTSGKLVPLGGWNSKKELPIITVDAADLNGNGTAEIFVTRLLEMPRSRQPDVRQWDLNSLVLEMQNGRLVEIASDFKYYFRSLVLPGNQRRMLAQKRGVSGTYGEQDFMSKSGTGSLFLGNIFHLEWKDGKYVAGDPVLLPKNVTLYDFTFGDVLNDGSEVITALKAKGNLTLLEPGGKIKWSGKDRFGGTAIYLEYPSLEGSSEMDRYYIRQRLFITDIDQDGDNDVILTNNYDFGHALASRLRVYTNGAVSCLNWGKRSLQEKWTTEEMAGFISDLSVVDIDGDARPELVYVVVEKGAGSFSDGESFIVIQKPPTGSR